MGSSPTVMSARRQLTTSLTWPKLFEKSSRTKVEMQSANEVFEREIKAIFIAASLITRETNSKVDESSRGTATAPRNRQPQNAATHSNELGAQSSTRSLVRTPRRFNS